MSETPPEFDLKFLPDWLKETSSGNRFAEYEGQTEDRRGDRSRDSRGPGGRSDRGPRGPRPGGGGGDRRPGGHRPGGPGGPGGGRREGGPARSGDRPQGGRGPDNRSGGGYRGGDRDRGPRPPMPPPAPLVAVTVEFLPEINGAEGIARQIKQSGRAYPLFGTGRLFLERPERHRVKITATEPGVTLYQIDDGPVATDRAAIERGAFQQQKAKYYTEETVQGEPLKGNFTNVARARSGGALLGPTNYHGYQPSLRKLYEERYSRRMSFQEFVHQEIEIVYDEQTVNDWKEQARSSTTYTTTLEPEPLTFKTLSEVEQHFRATYLPAMVKSGASMECSGPASRLLPDRSISAAVRDAWEKERAFPAGLVNHLRPYLLNAGLHFFKHKKRVLYISATRPVRHAAGQTFSPGVAAILSIVEAHPRCTRRDILVKVLGENHEDPEQTEKKAALARDLHYLIHSGHVIEFHDGNIELPLAPNAGQQQQGSPKKGGAAAPTAAAAAVAPSPTEEEGADLEESIVEETADPAPPPGELSEAPTTAATAEEPALEDEATTPDADAPADAPTASLTAETAVIPEITNMEPALASSEAQSGVSTGLDAPASELEAPVDAPLPGSEVLQTEGETSAFATTDVLEAESQSDIGTIATAESLAAEGSSSAPDLAAAEVITLSENPPPAFDLSAAAEKIETPDQLTTAATEGGGAEVHTEFQAASAPETLSGSEDFGSQESLLAAPEASAFIDAGAPTEGAPVADSLTSTENKAE